VELLAVPLGMLVEEDEIRRETLEAPVLLGLERLAREDEVLGAFEADREDRQVARDSVAPERGRVEDVRLVSSGLRGEAAVRADDARRKLLEKACVVGGETEVPHGDLRVRAGQRERAHGG